MTTPATALAPPVCDDATVDRVSDLLIALERGDPRRLVLRPIADIHCVSIQTVCVYATVFVDAGDGAGPRPFALHEVHLAARVLTNDPPFPAAPCLAGRLVEAALASIDAAERLQRSLN